MCCRFLSSLPKLSENKSVGAGGIMVLKVSLNVFFEFLLVFYFCCLHPICLELFLWLSTFATCSRDTHGFTCTFPTTGSCMTSILGVKRVYLYRWQQLISFCMQGTDKFECVISCREKGFAVMD
jgi:hypothetical protein